MFYEWIPNVTCQKSGGCFLLQFFLAMKCLTKKSENRHCLLKTEEIGSSIPAYQCNFVSLFKSTFGSKWPVIFKQLLEPWKEN